jgi:hypothetical protein
LKWLDSRFRVAFAGRTTKVSDGIFPAIDEFFRSLLVLVPRPTILSIVVAGLLVAVSFTAGPRPWPVENSQ